jgi:thiol-disulfide isomerase/thioredoxin
MKRAGMIFATAIATAIGVAGGGGVRAAESSGGLALGTKVPAAVAKTKMKNVDGKMLSIADVAGKAGTLVIFTCNHCPFAKDWEQRIIELGNGYAGKGVGVMLVNANDPAAHAEDGFEEMQARAKSRGMKIPYVVDDTSGVARAFGASVTPEAFLFDKTGKLAYHGTIDDNRKQPDQVKSRYLKDALDAVVAGKPPAVPETKGLGCGIKFRK